MSKYTAEQVERLAYVIDGNPEKMDGGEYYDKVSDAAEKLRDYATFLRESESAKAAVTEDITRKLGDEYFRLCKLADRNPLQAGFWVAQLQGALEAVAPMLASARVPSKMDTCGGIVDEQYVDGWNACREAMLAAAPKPEIQE